MPEEDYDLAGFAVGVCRQMGVKFELGKEIKDIKELTSKFDYIILCIGAHKNMPLKLEKGESLNALKFLEEFNKTNGKVNLGKNVVIIGGGNTAMDAARSAKRNEGVKRVSLVYRRTKRYMPALEEELQMALEDGIDFKELLAPVKLENGKLLCKKMKLSDYDDKGRRNVVETDETEYIDADTVIASIGEQIDFEFYKSQGIEIDDRGKPKCNKETNESSIKNVYIAGDGLYGAATIVEAIRDAKVCAEAILNKTVAKDLPSISTEEAVYSKKGNLKEISKDAEFNRCLTCDFICESCAEVCPNRANISLKIDGAKMSQIIHVDYMCNECGNCETFCPYSSAPYKDKFTLFASEEDMNDSKNDGFLFLDKDGNCKVRLDGKIESYKVGNSSDFNGVYSIIDGVFNKYNYLIL